MEKDIENLIEQLTKVRPEMLNEEALKLFNTIMAVLDERDKLREENKLKKEIQDDLTSVYLNGIYDERDRWITKIKDKIKELNEDIEYQKQYGNTAKREKLEEKKETYLDLLEDF